MIMADHELQRNEVLLLPFFGQGHLFPFIELSKRLSTSLNFTTTLLIPSSLSSSIPASLRHHDHRLHVVEMTSSVSPSDPPPMPGPSMGPQLDLRNGLESFISGQSSRPACVIIDVMMSWAKDLFKKFGIPIVALFTSGACSAAMEYGYWKAHVSDLQPGQARVIPGLPEDMAVSYSDIKRQAHHPHHPPGPHMPRPGFGPPGPRPPPRDHMGLLKGPPKFGEMPRWMDDVESTIGIMMNTCHELEGPFLEYLANHIGKPIWGVGPLLPTQYWSSDGESDHDHQDVRPNKPSNYTVEEVTKWLDSKAQGSVIYISFGTEVGPSLEEYHELASALEETTQSFVWVIQESRSHGPRPHLGPGSEPTEGYNALHLENKVGERGLIIRGWAPQLIILRHKSIGRFVSHCGWNSVVEAIGQGVPILAWPIRGDQHHNAKLVTSYLKVGCMVSDASAETVKKDYITQGIQNLLSNTSIKEHAEALKAVSRTRVANNSKTALVAFQKYVLEKMTN